ncbi:hypothetical protein B0T22DRAFT_112882 [Podospora appendiculata]|uniref:Response regulatory domain-containing protein n=1 Tax=Podospora appendiculata TaxID=314037 RepID=A0AAE0XLG2_9PEZI|nr:hypothetical protein B0T22DRAFT_112882 [Podospora appendiculata]
MGDFRAKLRAKFPRRHSGVPSLTSSKSSDSRPVSECTANGHGADNAETPLLLTNGGGGGGGGGGKKTEDGNQNKSQTKTKDQQRGTSPSGTKPEPRQTPAVAKAATPAQIQAQAQAQQLQAPLQAQQLQAPLQAQAQAQAQATTTKKPAEDVDEELGTEARNNGLRQDTTQKQGRRPADARESSSEDNEDDSDDSGNSQSQSEGEGEGESESESGSDEEDDDDDEDGAVVLSRSAVAGNESSSSNLSAPSHGKNRGRNALKEVQVHVVKDTNAANSNPAASLAPPAPKRTSTSDKSGNDQHQQHQQQQQEPLSSGRLSNIDERIADHHDPVKKQAQANNTNKHNSNINDNSNAIPAADADPASAPVPVPVPATASDSTSALPLDAGQRRIELSDPPVPAPAPTSAASHQRLDSARPPKPTRPTNPTTTTNTTSSAALLYVPDATDANTAPTAASNPQPHSLGPSSSDASASAAATTATTAAATAARPTGPLRRQSLLPSRQTTLIRTLLSAVHAADDLDPSVAEHLLEPISATMVTRKIWVRRPGASATIITINEEDLVDDVREMILKKYANSLGRHFDAPDLVLRIAPREQQRQERVLGPEEPMARTLDAYFPGGQTVDEALIIDIPVRRTPRESPRTGPPHAQHLNSVYFEDLRPSEGGTDYFGPGAVANLPVPGTGAVVNGTAHPHTISVLNTGQVPQIPSPGGTRPRAYRDRPDRPRLGRQHTSSPTIIAGVVTNAPNIAAVANHDQPTSAASQTGPGPPPAPHAPPLPTPPIVAVQEATPVTAVQRVATPPPRVASPRPVVPRPKKKKTVDHPSLPAGMLSGGVPPINVLIVEDNIINLRLLEAFVKRLKVRWQTAMNGREAVTKWRSGGFHLVLMDIQLPIMSGLEATREIRRLERMNSIGVFSSDPKDNTNPDNKNRKSGETAEEDKLENMELFKSPVIIVALTASSLQSDRHEALAAGCNDFLTKPVTYVWLERKVMEWGCMQALIDFDGWRKWKDFAPSKIGGDDAAMKKFKAKKARASITTSSDTH